LFRQEFNLRDLAGNMAERDLFISNTGQYSELTQSHVLFIRNNYAELLQIFQNEYLKCIKSFPYKNSTFFGKMLSISTFIRKCFTKYQKSPKLANFSSLQDMPLIKEFIRLS
jgi:hypothetical protein